MTHTEPFIATSYDLVSCRLDMLDPAGRAAVELSRPLAAMDPWSRLGYQERQLYQGMTRPDPALKRYGVSVADRAAGLIQVRHPWLRGPYLELLAVLPDFQGQGLGRELMAWLEGQARISSKNVWVLVSAFNDRARGFYAGLGYRETAVLTDLVASGYDEILLRKSL
ncbi:MAG: GNAT family N-acetyltransferase [Proteobacteria bacterium]|nr:GNAT family N-acetyltransferase [Pseudomonadota bacterium]